MADAPMPAIVRSPAASELIVGGQKSGKSRRAEELARAWLAAAPGHRALLIATACAGDPELDQRIARHRADRAVRCPALQVLEEPLALAAALRAYSAPDTLLVVDCLTLWLTQHMFPAHRDGALPAPVPPEAWAADLDALLQALAEARGPVVLVSNEIGLGVIPLGREVRAFVDRLGQLNQALAAACSRVTLMAAGLPLFLKGAP
jgi:adenosylcobinamide kinase / adenosylcobinamide-phosphate guanylyltransferase